MANSLIPADHEIRVLLTIKNGQVTERRLHDDELVATPERFIEIIRSLRDAPEVTDSTKE